MEVLSNPKDSYTKFLDEIKDKGNDLSIIYVEDATDIMSLASILGCNVRQLFKTVCLNFKTNGERYFVAVILPASAQADFNKISKELNISPKKLKIAQRDLIVNQTGFQPGEIPPLGFKALRFIDHSFFEHEMIFAGGGLGSSSYLRFETSILKQIYPTAKVGKFTTLN